jgi:hypothetical protein
VLQLRQRWSGNEALWAALQKDATPLGKARLHYFWLNKGPWSILDDNQSFMPAEVRGIAMPAKKPEGGQFLSGRRQQAGAGNLDERLPARTRNRRSGSSPPSAAGATASSRPSSIPRNTSRTGASWPAAEARPPPSTDNASLKKFLSLRADAFLSNDYLASDFAWMDLDRRSTSPSARTRPITTSCSATRPRSKPTSTSATRRKRAS